jgi:hypothetical protein
MWHPMQLDGNIIDRKCENKYQSSGSLTGNISPIWISIEPGPT